MDIRIYESLSTIKNLDSLKQLKKEFNEACDKRAEVIENCIKASKLTDKNFGYIKECFENLSPVLFESKEGRELIGKYVKTVKKSDELSKYHALYEGIRKSGKDTDVDYFVNEVSSLGLNMNKKKVNEDSKKLGRILAEAYMLIGEDAEELLPKENVKLYESVSFISENEKNVKNIAKFGNAVKVIKEFVEKAEDLTGEDYMPDDSSEDMISKFNENYSGELNEDEMELVKEMANAADSENVFNKYKEMCLEKVEKKINEFDKNGDKESKMKMESLAKNLKSKQYTSKSVNEDIIKLLEMSKLFD